MARLLECLYNLDVYLTWVISIPGGGGVGVYNQYLLIGDDSVIISGGGGKLVFTLHSMFGIFMLVASILLYKCTRIKT